MINDGIKFDLEGWNRNQGFHEIYLYETDAGFAFDAMGITMLMLAGLSKEESSWRFK